MSRIEYSNLLFEVSEQLDQLNSLGRLLSMCRDLVSLAVVENVQDALSLFRRLEELNTLRIDRLEVVKELLKGLREWSLFEKVKKFQTKRKDYTDLLGQISRAIDERHHLEQLVVICRRKTSEEYEGNVHNVRTLLKELENRGYLEFDRLDFLKEILIEAERDDMVKEVQDFEKRRNDEDEFERRQGKYFGVFFNSVLHL